jgi:anti-sigma factor RsiW
MKIDVEGSGRHRQVWELIPWVINGRATALEQRLVEEHLKGCADCRREFDFQRNLHATLRDAPQPISAPHSILQKLWARIEAEERDSRAAPSVSLPRSGRRLRRSFRLLPKALAAAVVAEAIAIGALVSAGWPHTGGSAPYQTLTTATVTAPAATIRVVLVPATTLSELQALLASTKLQIVGGPDEGGVYSLAPLPNAPALSQDAVVEQLRMHPAVRFAEPLRVRS